MSCPCHFDNRSVHWAIGLFESLWTLWRQPSLDFAFQATRHHPMGRKHFHKNGILFHGTMSRRCGKTRQTNRVIVRISNATPFGLTPSMAIKILPTASSEAGSDIAKTHDLLLLSDVPSNRRKTFFSTGFSSMVLNDVYYNNNRLDFMAKRFEEMDPVNRILAKTNPYTRALSVSHVFDDTFAIFVYPTQHPPIADLSDFDPTRRYKMKLDVYGVTVGKNNRQSIAQVGVIEIPRQKPIFDDGTHPVYFQHHALEEKWQEPYARYMSACKLGTRYWGGRIKSRMSEDVAFSTRAPFESSECADYNKFVLQTTTDIYNRTSGSK
jgi:hypothetical protein